MSLKKLISLCGYTLLVLNLFGQHTPVDFNNYQTVLSQGSLPQEFATTSTEKYIENSKTITREDSRKTRKAKREFYLQSAFAIDNVLRSGRVLFNDPIGNYVNLVFNKVIEPEPELRDKVKVFVVKTEYSNAFATDQGLIFITTGLLARLQNEAQLAFVLCHELVHFKKKHSIDVFVKQETRDREDMRKNGGFESEPEILSRAAYSKDKEIEADELGLELYLKSGFSKLEAINTFDVLHHAHLPFDSIKVENTFFDTKNLVWPYEYFKEEVTPIYADEDEDDSKSTHPNTFKRKQTIKFLLGDKKTGGKNFLISETDFYYIQKICRYELCRQTLLNQNYSEAIYYATLLQKENPESIFLKKVIAKSLFAVSAYATDKSKNKLHFNKYKNIQGNLQQLYYFFYKIKGKEANVLAAQYLWRLKQAHPNDDELAMLSEKTFYQLVKKHDERPYYFADTALPDNLNPKLLSPKNKKSTEQAADTATSLKTLKLKPSVFNTNKENEGNDDDDDDVNKAPKMNIRHAFAEFMQDSAFRKMFMDQVKLADADKDKGKPKKKKRIRGLNKKQGEKIVVLSPFHYSIDTRKTVALKLDANEKDMSTFITHIEESAQAANVPVELLAEKEIKTTDADKLNKLSLLKDWLGEKMEHDELNIPPTDYEQLMVLRKEIDARYICLLGHIHLIEKKENMGVAIVTSIFLPIYSWPFTIPYMIKKQQMSMTFMIVLDLETGKTIKTDFSTINANNTEDISLSTLYDFMLKIKKYQLENK